MNKTYVSRLEQFLPSVQDLEAFALRPPITTMPQAFERMIAWFNHLHDVRGANETSVLISAAHSKLIEIWILLPLGLVHSAYSALRTVIDISTSYTYYVTHPVEWSAVCEGRVGWMSRANIVEWHVHHTPGCREVNKTFGLAAALNQDYQELSSYVHGIPVAGLPTLKGIERPPISDTDLERFIRMAQKSDANLSLLFLSAFHSDLATISTSGLRTITRGIDRRKLATTGIVLPRA